MTAAAFLTSANPQAAIPADCIVEPSAAGKRPTESVTAVGAVLPDPMSLDETTDYFSAQGAIDRWKVLAA